MAGEAIANELSKLLRSRVTVTILILGLPTMDKARVFIDDVRGNPSVEAVTLASFEPGRAELSVVTDNVAGEELAAMVLRTKKFDVTARSVSAYEVEVEAR